MTKIIEILPIDPTGQATSKNKVAESNDGPSFREVLQKVTSGGGGQQNFSAEALGFEQSMAHTQDVADASAVDQVLSPKQVTGLMRAERTLEILGDYEGLLGNTNVSLKEMQGTVQALENEAKELNKLLEGLEPDDQLYPLLQDVATVAVVESIKFNRGDYITAATA